MVFQAVEMHREEQVGRRLNRSVSFQQHAGAQRHEFLPRHRPRTISPISGLRLCRIATIGAPHSSAVSQQPRAACGD
jgi:hypothetical protein